jgi:anti-sigma B factor antagonist
MGGNTPFRVTVDTRNDITRLALHGELDMATTPIFTDVLAESECDGTSILMIDLRDLTFMDSTGLHAFCRARDRARGNGHRLLFIGATDRIRSIFELTGMESVLEEHEAVTTLDQFTRRWNGHDEAGERRHVDA